MISALRGYRKLERHVWHFIAAEFCVQLINTAFFHILLVYMEKSGYADHESAGYVSFRFIGVLALAFPLGLLIRNRRIKPFLLYSSASIPLITLLIVLAIANNQSTLLGLLMTLWGISFLCYQLCAVPYILRNVPVSSRTEAISLSYATYSMGGIASGIIISSLRNINPVIFGEGEILIILTVLSFSGVFFLGRLKLKEHIPGSDLKILSLKSYDWGLVLRALIPTLIISTGAGLTIPFISIFFFNVHDMGSEVFPFYGALASLLVAFAALLVPYVKKTLTYRIAIPLTQSVAVIALIFLASTQLYSHLHVAAGIATVCYLIRQPLMNIAAPMTTEVVMGYVGEKNREMMSALTSAAWSGSWFISSWIFKWLRSEGMDYVYVFLITASLYATGVVWYAFLVREYDRQPEPNPESLSDDN